MTIVHRFGQRIRDAGTNPDHRRLLDAEPVGDRVSGLEADAADVAREPIGVLGHDLDGVGAIGLVNPNGTRGADAVAVQEDHDLAHDLLLRPGSGDASRPDRANAIDLTHPIGLGLDDVEHRLAEGLDHFPGVDRPDPADHAGGEILLDALDGTRRRGAHETRLELLAMGPVVDPFPRGGDPFAGGDRRRVADDGDEITMPARLDAQHAEAALGIVEGHPFDGAGEHLAVGLN